MHHSDTGPHYTSMTPAAELIDAGIVGSIGDALDGALCGSTSGLFKTDAVHDGGPTRAWVHWYDPAHLHSGIGHLCPIEFEQIHRKATQTTTDPEVA